MMVCFSACFYSSKHKKRRHLVNTHQRNGAGEAKSTKIQIEQPVNLIAVSEEKLEEPISCSAEKKVGPDLNHKANEEFPTYELLGKNEQKKNEKKEETPEASKSASNSIVSALFSHPPNNRYQNCANIDDDDEIEDLDLEDESSLDDGCNDDDNKKFISEELSESLFSLSIESRKHLSDAELGEKEVTSPMPDCISPVGEINAIELNRNAWDGNQFVDSVLNPVENLTQWRAVKQKTVIHLQDQGKENMYSEKARCGVPIIEQSNFKHSTRRSNPGAKDKKPGDQEIAVDTSLSSWLVETEITPFSQASTNSLGNSPSVDSKSPRIHEERPILGALTMEELRQHSISTSPKRLKTWSPDETPIIGTVGSYWRHTGQTPNSDSISPSKRKSKTSTGNRKDERANWDATTFQTRLEMALDQGAVEV